MNNSKTLKLIQEAINLTITLDMKDTSMITGILIFADEKMNIKLENVKIINSEGKSSDEKMIFLRGSTINFIIFPPALMFAPFLVENQ